MSVTSISEKGQITLPVKLRAQLGMKAHDRVFIEVDEQVIVIKKVPDIWKFKGSIPGKGLSLEEERRLMAEGVAAHVLGKE